MLIPVYIRDKMKNKKLYTSPRKHEQQQQHHHHQQYKEADGRATAFINRPIATGVANESKGNGVN